MRTPLRLVALLALALAVPATAGEFKHLGVITVAGASLNNTTTAVPFKIAGPMKLTLYCTAAVQVLTDAMAVSTATTGTKGVPVAALVLFPSSVGAAITTLSGQPTSVISIIGTGSCDVWQRLGTE